MKKLAMIGLATVMAGSIFGSTLVAQAAPVAQEADTDALNQEIARAVGDQDPASRAFLHRLISSVRGLPQARRFLSNEVRFFGPEEQVWEIQAIAGKAVGAKVDVEAKAGSIELDPRDPMYPGNIIWQSEPGKPLPDAVVRILQRIDNVTSESDAQPNVVAVTLKKGESEPYLKAVFAPKQYRARQNDQNGPTIRKPILKQFKDLQSGDETDVANRLQNLRQRLQDQTNSRLPDQAVTGINQELIQKIQELRQKLAGITQEDGAASEAAQALRGELQVLLQEARASQSQVRPNQDGPGNRRLPADGQQFRPRSGQDVRDGAQGLRDGGESAREEFLNRLKELRAQRQSQQGSQGTQPQPQIITTATPEA